MLKFFTSLTAWDWLDIVGVVFVLVGVAGEVCIPLLKFKPKGPCIEPEENGEDVPAMSDWRARREAWESLRTIWEHRAGYLVVIGLGLELIALPHHFIEAGELSDRAASAQKLASESNIRASSNELAALKLGSNNLVLRSNVVRLETQLERVKAPRTITAEQALKFTKFVDGKAKGPVSMATSVQDTETLNFIVQVITLLTNCGYTIPSSMVYPTLLSFNNLQHIAVGVHSLTSAPPSAEVLLFALREMGFNPLRFTNGTVPDMTDSQPGQVRLFIGPKPVGGL